MLLPKPTFKSTAYTPVYMHAATCPHETHTHPREHVNYKTPCISSVGNSALQGDTCADSETIMKVIEL